MFSSSMEVDRCLEELARVLVASGSYICQDSCFSDTDIPAMLKALETPHGLDSPQPLASGPCGYGDLSPALEMAPVSGQWLLDTCVSDSLADWKLTPDEPCHGNLRDSHTVIDPGSHPMTPHRDSIFSQDMFLYSHDSYSCEPPVNTVGRIHNVDMTVSMTDNNPHQLPQPAATPVATSAVANSCCRLGAFCQHSQGSTLSAGNSPPQSSLYPELSAGHSSPQSSLYPELSAGHSSPQSSLYPEISAAGRDAVLSSRPKQKRKRRSKGYCKSTKSKKKKNRDFTESQPQSKPKKQKTAKSELDHVTATDSTSLVDDGGPDVPQEDSGFESGDGRPESSSDSSEAIAEVVDMGIVFTSGNSAAVATREANQSLRRSSRTTRNPENYNFRLSSLVKRVETERRQLEPRQPKDKSKPPPLSKYRRRTANARERDRMKEINDAFDTLRASLPSIHRDDGKNKITKFTILKHALNYIASLRELLGMDSMSPLHDDDVSSDLSSVAPASSTSSAAEDSCSSPTSAHPMSSLVSTQYPAPISDIQSIANQSSARHLTPEPTLPPGSSLL